VSSSPTETLIDVTMPQMGVSVAEGTIVEWRVEVGDRVTADQTVCDISTDKIDTEVPSPTAGVITEILVPVGETVPVGTVLARMGSGEGGVPASNGNGASSGADVAEAAGPAARSAAPAVNGERPARGRGARYSPVVQRIAAEHDVDLSQVTGTGRDGRVRKQDVLAFIEQGDGHGATAPDPPLHIESPYRPDPAVPAAAAASAGTPASAAPTPSPAAVVGEGGQLSRMRRQIGEHMKRSLDTAATCTTWIEVDMSRVERERKQLGVTALAFVSRACIAALREYPALNAWLEGDRYTRHQEVNLGIAVSLGEDGLIVPVIHRAHELSEEGFGARVRDLARRARSRQLTPDEVNGGTFTITNPGQYGSIMATPIINQPQVAILDFEAVVKRPVVITDAEGNDMIAIRPMTILGLSWDHRALDGALSAQFLAAVKRHLEGSA
jgi:pyruvate/2-oxoglutarate dehydrogenase complex dihydrolipoamide acyltransferase (E2) component